MVGWFTCLLEAFGNCDAWVTIGIGNVMAKAIAIHPGGASVATDCLLAVEVLRAALCTLRD